MNFGFHGVECGKRAKQFADQPERLSLKNFNFTFNFIFPRTEGY
jgi:hypothetical protein